MDIKQIVDKKEKGLELTTKEIEFFVDGFVKDKISKLEATSFIKAVYEKGLTKRETVDLTRSMAFSGEVVDLSSVGECVDKHSTGGVSDTKTLIIVPTLASLGVKVAKMSGRSLGWTGGTADKIEVFDGYDNYISEQEFKQNLLQINECLISQSENIALADKKIYKLRDETGYVDNIPLIASSIMSKKIACGAKVLCLDVKYGNGAFMKDFDSAKQLAQLMCEIGREFGIKTTAVISNMNEPLSCYIGNNLEVYSALSVLNGEENNLSKLSKTIVATILKVLGKCKTIEEGVLLATESINKGKAINKFKQLVLAQKGDTYKIDHREDLLKANKTYEILASTEGYLSTINARELGNLSHKICEFYSLKQDKNMCGIILLKQKNDYVKKGEVLAKVNLASNINIDEILKGIANCLIISQNKGKEFELIKEILF